MEFTFNGKISYKGRDFTTQDGKVLHSYTVKYDLGRYDELMMYSEDEYEVGHEGTFSLYAYSYKGKNHVSIHVVK